MPGYFACFFRTTSIAQYVWPGCLPRLSWLALGLALLSVTPCPAQITGDTILQLDMLDTPTDDLIRLGTTYADSLRDVKSARLSMETIHRMRGNAVVTPLEEQIARLNLEAAERKVQIVRMIVEKQLAAAENKLEILKYMESLPGAAADQAGNGGTERNFIRANDEATVRILKAILAMK